MATRSCNFAAEACLKLSDAETKLKDFAAWLFFGVEKERSDGPLELDGCLALEEANGPNLLSLPNLVYMCGLDGYLTLCQKIVRRIQIGRPLSEIARLARGLRGWLPPVGPFFEGSLSLLRACAG